MRTWLTPMTLLAVASSVTLVACDPAPSKEGAAEKTAAATEDAAPTHADAHAENHGDAEAGECLHGPEAHNKEGGCGGGEAPPAAGTEGHFGSEFALASSVPLSQAITALDGANTVQVSGEVTSVCQSMGCWMVIKDHESDEVMARVLMKDRAFSVPMDGKGKKAVVEGELTEKTLSAGQVKHLAKDAGEDPSKVEGERKEYVLTATAVKLES